MLEAAFNQLSPILLERYAALLRRKTSGSRELASMHATYLDYALLDARMPRPVLAYFGFHAAADEVSFTDPDALGDVVFVPQLLRDVLAIHDDVVDEDTEKFGRPPLPVVLSAPERRGTGEARHRIVTTLSASAATPHSQPPRAATDVVLAGHRLRFTAEARNMVPELAQVSPGDSRPVPVIFDVG